MRRISQALVEEGIAVMSFDFTGLGNSDGDFANTNFSSNLQDLLAAVDFLRREYEAPRLLIGHSLGGAAVLAMAGRVEEAGAVVSIAAPSRAENSGVRSTFTTPVTPYRPNSTRRPCDPQMMLLLTVAPDSISLPGQIFTLGWITAPSPTRA